MVATLPLPPCNWAMVAACADAAGPGTPLATSESVTLDRNWVIRTVPRMANPRLAP